jgi:hypothetical protein
VVEKEFGIKIKVGGLKWTPDSFKVQIDAMTGADDATLEGVDPKYVHEIKKWVETRDLFMKTTTIGGIACTVVGMKPRSSQGTMIIRRSSDNSLRLVNTHLVRAGLVK